MGEMGRAMKTIFRDDVTDKLILVCLHGPDLSRGLTVVERVRFRADLFVDVVGARQTRRRRRRRGPARWLLLGSQHLRVKGTNRFRSKLESVYCSVFAKKKKSVSSANDTRGEKHRAKGLTGSVTEMNSRVLTKFHADEIKSTYCVGFCQV